VSETPCRAGFSLLEVILATAILLGAAIVLAELASVGRQHADSAEELAAAQLVCRNKLNEILSGATPLKTISGATLQDPTGWLYSVEVDSLGPSGKLPGLAELRVTVAEDVSDDRPARQFTLTRWIRDPRYTPDYEDESAFGTGSPLLDLPRQSIAEGLP